MVIVSSNRWGTGVPSSQPRALLPRLRDGILPDTTGSRHRTLSAHVGVAVITRRSAHRSLLRTHEPGSPLLLCPARTLVPLAPVQTHS